MHDLFDTAGIALWRAHLEASEAFDRAARGWSGTVLLREDSPNGSARRSWISLTDGSLTETRLGTVDDELAAEFVLAAPAATWQALVTGKRQLAAAAFAGEIKLEKGSVLKLLPHLRAATELLRAAGE